MYKPLLNTDQFGGYLFVTGAFFLVLSVSRSYYCLDLLVLQNFPACLNWGAGSVQALVMVIATGLMALAGFLLVVAETLTFHHERIR